MPLPSPEPGLVIQYEYLWRREHERGRDNARYPRPCAVVVAVKPNLHGEVQVVVVPFTHQQPELGQEAVEIPSRVLQSLGLPKRTWAIVDEVNTFSWPGFDLALSPSGEVAWGFIPPLLHERLKAGVKRVATEGRLRMTRR